MRSRTFAAASAATAFTLAFTAPAPAPAAAIIFDSLNGAASFAATTIFGPPLAATFTTGASAVRVDVALSLSSIYLDGPSSGNSYTVSLDGGIPLSDLTFDPANGLMSPFGSFVQAWEPVIKSVTLPLTSLPSIPTIERYDQFSDVPLSPNSLYWIEVSTADSGEAAVAWGITNDVSGPGVAGNYLESDLTDDAFFLNKGVDPWPFDNAFQMEIAAAPELSTWLMMALGFAALCFFPVGREGLGPLDMGGGFAWGGGSACSRRIFRGLSGLPHNQTEPARTEASAGADSVDRRERRAMHGSAYRRFAHQAVAG